MKRTHLVTKHSPAVLRSRRRRMQLKAIRRSQHKRRLIFFQLENNYL